MAWFPCVLGMQGGVGKVEMGTSSCKLTGRVSIGQVEKKNIYTRRTGYLDIIQCVNSFSFILAVDDSCIGSIVEFVLCAYFSLVFFYYNSFFSYYADIL